MSENMSQGTSNKGEYLFGIMSGAKDGFIDEMLSEETAAEIRAANKRSRIRMHSAVAAIAAALALVIGLSALPSKMGLDSTDNAGEQKAVGAERLEKNNGTANGGNIADKSPEVYEEAAEAAQDVAEAENGDDGMMQDVYGDDNETDAVEEIFQNGAGFSGASGFADAESVGELFEMLDLYNCLHCVSYAVDGEAETVCTDDEFRGTAWDMLFAEADMMYRTEPPASFGRHVTYHCYLETDDGEQPIDITVDDGGYMLIKLAGQSLWFENQNAAQLVDSY